MGIFEINRILSPGGNAKASLEKNVKVYRDLAYDSLSKLQTLDLYVPEHGDEKIPLMVFIHGGGFAGCDKSDFQQDAWITLTKAGYAVASLNYRLAGKDPHPAGLVDCKTAIRYLKAHADEYGIDKAEVAVSGGSSGGHYALMVALTSDHPEFDDLSRGYAEETSDVQAATVIYASTDLRLILKDAFDIPADATKDWKRFGAKFAIQNVERYLDEKITDPYDDEVHKACPIAYVHERQPPILLQHGDKDELCPVNQSISFYEYCKEHGIDNIELDIIRGAKHGTHPNDEFADPRNMRRIQGFLDKYLKQEKWAQANNGIGRQSHGGNAERDTLWLS